MKKICISFVMLCIMLCFFSNIPGNMDVHANDDVIQRRIDSLYDLVGGKYFNVGQNSACGKKCSGHGCDNCDTSKIVNASWFKNIFGSVSTSQFPNTYYNGGEKHSRTGKSCFGFAAFAEWYIFKESDSDIVNTTYEGTYNFNFSNISNYAQKGDLLRLHKGGTSGHSAIFISADSTGIHVLDSNWSGANNCMVQKHVIRYNSSSYLYFSISRSQNRDTINETGIKLILNKASTPTNKIIDICYYGDELQDLSSYLIEIAVPDDITPVYSRLYDGGVFANGSTNGKLRVVEIFVPEVKWRKDRRIGSFSITTEKNHGNIRIELKEMEVFSNDDTYIYYDGTGEFDNISGAYLIIPSSGAASSTPVEDFYINANYTDDVLFTEIHMSEELVNKNGKVLLTVCDDNEMVVSYVDDATDIIKHEIGELSANKTYTIKAFYWEDMCSLKPLCDMVSTVVYVE